MKKREYIMLAAIIGLLAYILTLNKEVEYITLPPRANSKVITTPQPIQVMPTDGVIVAPRLISAPQQKNDSILKLYLEAKDSIQKLQIIREVISERTYREELKDSTQTITVETTVTGYMREQNISYVTNPITLERTSKKSPTRLYLGAFSNIPTEANRPISVGGNLNIQTKSHIYSLGYDNQKNISVGVAFKLF